MACTCMHCPMLSDAVVSTVAPLTQLSTLPQLLGNAIMLHIESKVENITFLHNILFSL